MSSISIFGKIPDVAINYSEHPGQSEISDKLSENFSSTTPASIISIIAGRGWGKTLYFVCSILAPYLDQHPNCKAMWVAPSYQVAMTPIDDVFKGIDEITGKRYVPEFDHNGHRVWEFVTTKSGSILKWWNGAIVYFKSADAPDSIVSKGFNLIVMDEASLQDEQVFTMQILGTARKRGIKIFMIGTPRGKKHFTYKVYLKGQDTNDHEYISFQQASYRNIYFNETLKKLVKDIPDWLHRQEYLAEFIEDGDTVFKNLSAAFHGPEIHFESNNQHWEQPIVDVNAAVNGKPHITLAKDRVFIAAVDFAKSVDFTVITVMDMNTGDLVYYRRLNKEDYRVVLDLVSRVCKKFNSCDVIFDATGVGQGLADMFNNYDVTAHPFVFTNESKTEIVNKLILSVEYQEIRLPNIMEINKELSAYTYSMTRTGKISYNAPSGFHDDIVMSLAMGNFYRKENAGMDNLGMIDDIITINKGGYNKKSDFYEFMAEDND